MSSSERSAPLPFCRPSRDLSALAVALVLSLATPAQAGWVEKAKSGTKKGVDKAGEGVDKAGHKTKKAVDRAAERVKKAGD